MLVDAIWGFVLMLIFENAMKIIIWIAVVLLLFQTSRSNRGSVGGYFLAGRNMNWLPVSIHK